MRVSERFGTVDEPVWVDIGGGLDIKIDKLGSTATKVHNHKNTKKSAIISKYAASAEEEVAIRDRDIINTLAHTVLLDWKGFIGDDDKPIPYTHKNAERLLTEFSWLKELVIELSLEKATFSINYREEAKNNLKKPCNGS